MPCGGRRRDVFGTFESLHPRVGRGPSCMRQILSILLLASLALVSLPVAAAECGVDESCLSASASTDRGAGACVIGPTYTCAGVAWITYGEGGCSTGATQLVFVGGSSVTPLGTVQAGAISSCGTGYYPEGPAETTSLLGYLIVSDDRGEQQYVPFGWQSVEGHGCAIFVGETSTECPAGLAPPFVYPGTPP